MIIIALAGAIILVSLMGRFSFTLGAVDLEMDVDFFTNGTTEIIIPPVGTISARTHAPILKISIMLKNVNLNLLENFLQRFNEEEKIVKELKRTISKYLWFFFARILLLAFIGGCAGVYIVGGKSLRSLLTGGIIGFFIIGIILGSIWLTYDIYAFNNPQFTGILEAAPWAFRLVNQTLEKVDLLGEQLQAITENLYLLFRQIETLPGITALDEEIALLHVSDIHNNPAALDLIEQIISTFNIDLVVDTGDITDYGTPLEASLLERVGKFSIPYIFIPGNHDSPSVVKVMKTLPNVIVLEEDIVEISGIKIAGIADPASVSSEMKVEPQHVYNEYITRLHELVDNTAGVNIIAAHHPMIVEMFTGIPLLLTGHNHQQNLQIREGSVISNAGSTGAAGVRGLQSNEEIPYSLTVIYFNNEDGELQLRAADLVRVFQLSSGFSLERRNLASQLPAN